MEAEEEEAEEAKEDVDGPLQKDRIAGEESSAPQCIIMKSKRAAVKWASQC